MHAEACYRVLRTNGEPLLARINRSERIHSDVNRFAYFHMDHDEYRVDNLLMRSHLEAEGRYNDN